MSVSYNSYRPERFQVRHSLLGEGSHFNPTSSSMEKLHATIARAQFYLKQARVTDNATSIVDEVATSFRTRGRAKPRTAKCSKKMKFWQVVPVCLADYSRRAPTKGAITRLCMLGLGCKWFCNEDKLSIPMCLTADEVHFLLTCLYPQLQSIPYELCKATGPGHCVLVPLAIEDETKKPRRESPFTPYFSCVKLKELIGRKGKLYIRPLEAIQDDKCPSLTETEVIFVLNLMSFCRL